MKKIGWMVVAVSLSLSMAALAGNQPKTERPASKSKTEEPKMQKVPPARALAGQIAQLKQEHQAAMSELEAIKKMAAEEKATKTVGALDKLMTRRNQDFQQRLSALQQRLSKLETQGKSGEEKGKTEDKKDKSKDKNKGAGRAKEG